jgi:hypothetical protein
MPGSYEGSPSHANPLIDVVAMDGLGIIGTVGFFVPAAVLIALVVGAVVRDRRLSAREAAEEARPEGFEREEIPGPPPRAD